MLEGIEAVIDKDRAAALLAKEVSADALLMLTDVEAVFRRWGTPDQEAIRQTAPEELGAMSFAVGSMGPKVEAARIFVSESGGVAGIGRLQAARAILDRKSVG